MTSIATHHFPGPAELGRGAVLLAGMEAPEPLTDAPRYAVDDATLQDPAPLAGVLHHHWARREPVVIELAVANDQLRSDEVEQRPIHDLDAGFTFERERLHALLWANNWDLRDDQPVWWHAVLAQRRLDAAPSDTADVRLPDGTHAWCDGGPREPLGLPLLHRESIALGRATIGGDAEPAELLADDQLAAVRHGGGAARVIAPAGSGKTRVLTARLRHLLRDRRVEPELVTAVAYNRRAADEMRGRLADVPGAHVRTIHSLAWWICSLDEERSVIEERDVRAILDRLVRVGRVPNQDPFQPWLEALAEVRLALRDPEQVEVQRGDVDGLAEVFPRFRAELARRGVLDFDEQVHRAVEVLLTRPDIRRTVQRRCTHLLVDEFQDLTPAFMLLLRLAAGPFLQVFAVGDDDQVIYSYSGATPDHLIDFTRYFPAAGSHALRANHRCPPAVVEHADTLLSHNRRRLAKTIVAGRTDGPADALTVHRVPVSTMAARVVTVTADLVDRGAAPRDIAVLARVNSQLLAPQVALGEAGIARTSPLDASVLGRTGIRTALAYLRMALEPDELRREDVLDTINRPSRRVKRAVEPFLRRHRTLTPAALQQVRASLDRTRAERFDGWLEDLAMLRDASAHGDTGRLLRIIRDDVGLGAAMGDLDASRTRPEGSSHTDDLDALTQLAALEPDPRRFRSWLVESLRHAGDPDGVVLSTVHRVKGLQWPHVVVFGANDGLFPHRLADDVEEERRILHVAITRCRTSVDIIAAADGASPFLPELDKPADDTGPQPGKRVTELVEREPTWAGDDVVADVGLSVELPGRVPATVTEAGGTLRATTPHGVVLDLAWGDPVVVDGRATRLVRRTPAPPRRRAQPGITTGASSRVLDALKAWRRERASADGVPPYVIMHDRHLEAIAARLPSSLRELAPCPGIGPTKLERYGDDILAVIEEATEPALP